MGIVSMVGKLVLVVTNIALILLSLAMITVGIIVVSGKDIFNSLVSDFDDKLKEAFEDLGVEVDTSNLTLTDFVLPLAYALIFLGVVIGAVSLIGCIGGCYTLKIVLIVYAIVLGVFFLVQLILIILVYADKSTLDSTVKPYIKDTLDDYEGLESSSATSLSWNALMNFEGCCGVDDYKDFDDLDNWPPTQVNDQNVTLVTPVICCRTKSENYTCAEQPTDENNYWKTGCYDKLFDLILGHALVITIIVLMVAAQFVLLFFTVWILCTMDNKIDII